MTQPGLMMKAKKTLIIRSMTVPLLDSNQAIKRPLKSFARPRPVFSGKRNRNTNR